jgi:serine/threonine-protein kinase
VIVERIGTGNTGELWLAKHALHGRRAAIKVLRPDLSSNGDNIAGFFKDARATTGIADLGIVPIFDFGEHVDGRVYVVMERLGGEPLDARLRRLGTLQVTDALCLVRQAAGSLGAAHARGLVHRSLEPSNIFIVPDPEGGERATLVDFGIARLTGGSPAYMSPEQCRDVGVDQRADIYALGCVLFELLTGEPPYGAKGVRDVHMREPAPTFASRGLFVPPELEALLARCLAKQAHQRYASGTALTTAIGTVLASPTLAATRMVRLRRSKPTTLSSLAGEAPPIGRRSAIAPLALIGIAIVTVVLASGRPEAEPTPAAAPPPSPPMAPTITPPIARPFVKARADFAAFANELAASALAATSR